MLRRISKTVNGTTTKYCYDGDQVICEYNSDSTLRKKYLYGAGIDEVVRMSHVWLTADINGDGIVDIYDLRAMAEVWLLKSTDAGFDPSADLNYDDKIDNADSDVLATNWLAESEIAKRADWLRREFLTGAAITVIVGLLILLTSPKRSDNSRAFGFIG